MKKQKVKLTKEEISFAVREGEYWDTHSLADVWDKTKPVEMEVDIQGSYVLIPIATRVAGRIEKAASRNGVSVEKWLVRAVQKELAIS